MKVIFVSSMYSSLCDCLSDTVVSKTKHESHLTLLHWLRFEFVFSRHFCDWPFVTWLVPSHCICSFFYLFH